MELLGIPAAQWLGILGFFGIIIGAARKIFKFESLNERQDERISDAQKLAQNALDKAEKNAAALVSHSHRSEEHLSRIESNVQIVMNEQTRQAEQYEKLAAIIEKESEKRAAESLKRDSFLETIVQHVTGKASKI